jgi:hypothetical protein
VQIGVLAPDRPLVGFGGLLGAVGGPDVVGNRVARKPIRGKHILINGTTEFDHGEAALLPIMDEWNSNKDYATRVADLTGAGNGTAFPPPEWLLFPHVGDGPQRRRPAAGRGEKGLALPGAGGHRPRKRNMMAGWEMPSGSGGGR